MSFDDKRRDTEEKLRQLAPAIGMALGAWRVTERHRHYYILTHPTDDDQVVGLSAAYPHAGKGRIAIRGVLPVRSRHGENVSTHGVTSPEITVAIERGAEAIASEITRRLLPGYLAGFAEMKGRIASAENDRDDRDQLAAKLARLCGAEASDGGRFSLPDELAMYGTVESQGDRVRIEASFSPEQAEALLRALVALTRKGQR